MRLEICALYAGRRRGAFTSCIAIPIFTAYKAFHGACMYDTTPQRGARTDHSAPLMFPYEQ